MVKEKSRAFRKVAERFCRSRLGRRLGRHSQEAQKLAFTLLGNPYWNTGGGYRVSLEDLAGQTALSVSDIPSLLSLLEGLGFCRYEPRSAWVTVPLLETLYQRLLPQKSPISLGESVPPSASDCQEKA